MLLNDKEILALCKNKDISLIENFVPGQVRTRNNQKVISFGLSSFGYDIRASRGWKIFTNINTTTVDPKNFDERSFVDFEGDVCIIPPNSFALTSSMEKVNMPETLTGLCIGKSTYARCGIIVNVTPIEAGWCGYITIEVSNTTPLPVKVYSQEGIAQILFMQGRLPKCSYSTRNGKYMNQPPVVVLPKV